MFCEAWKHHQQGQRLNPLATCVVDVIIMHPEYQQLLEDQDQVVNAEFSAEDGDSNPFMHMGMHIAIREQVSTDRPKGFYEAYQRIVTQHGDPHKAEHKIIDCLGSTMWRAQQHQAPPDENYYMECVRKLIKDRPH